MAEARRAAELVALILANPDDPSAYQVYADFLIERGDPRGEAIALALARESGHADERTMRREKALAGKHGDAWAGPLDRFVARDRRVFSRGFLVEATLKLPDRRAHTSLPDGIDLPDWSTLRTLRLSSHDNRRPELLPRFLALPGLARLRALHDVGPQALRGLVDGPPRSALVELAVAYDHQLADLERFTSGAAFPGLRVLELEAPNVGMSWLWDTPLAAQLEGVVLSLFRYPLGPTVAQVAEYKLPRLRELVFAHRFRGGHKSFRMTLRRDHTGELRDLEIAMDGKGKLPGPDELVEALASLPDNALGRFTVADGLELPYGIEHIAALETALSRFPSAAIAVPWSRVPGAELPGSQISLIMIGNRLGAEIVDELITRVSAPPLSFVLEGFAINRGAHQPVTRDVAATIRAAFANKRTHDVRVYETRGAGLIELHNWGNSLRLTSRRPETSAEVDAYLGFLVAWLEAHPVRTGSIAFPVAHQAIEDNASEAWLAFDALSRLDSHAETALDWLHIWGGADLEILDAGALERLPHEPGLERVRVWRTQHNVVVVAGDRPDELPDRAFLEALPLALARIADRALGVAPPGFTAPA